MKASILGGFTAVAVFAATVPAAAAPKTVTLDVPGMNCALCPITIKKALQTVQGVQKVDASYEKKEAVITFDDVKTDVERLIKATNNAGYPATLKGGTR